jgi:hypothetical protein
LKNDVVNSFASYLVNNLEDSMSTEKEELNQDELTTVAGGEDGGQYSKKNLGLSADELSTDEAATIAGGEDGGQYSKRAEELSADDLSNVAGGADGGQYYRKPSNEE